MAKKHVVLGDHKRVGKRFIPPFLHHLSGRFTDVEWVDRLAPEVLWIALLHDAYGLGVGAELALSAAQSLRSIKPKALGVRASDYGNLNRDEGRQWASNLDEDRCEQVRSALRPLVTMYPTFPMSSLLGAVDEDSPDDQQQLGRVLQPLLDRWSREATLVQGTVCYVAVVCGTMKLMQIPGADLRAIKDFPRTEESKLAAGLARTTTSALLSHGATVDSAWPMEFWNRGFELQSCEQGEQS